MSEYDFKSLSSADFEDLTRDLLQPELGISLESFKTGRDNGIDLRYSGSKGKNLIVQCKHYAGSSYSALLSILKNVELDKVKKLKPTRYLISTSIGLSPANKDEIFALFTPFCNQASDILGSDDLNGLLSKYPHIEKKHYKLWLTSSRLLEHIIHSKVFNQSEAEISQIKRKMCRYVQNSSFYEAMDILEANRYCIIAGIPGIGKTTLAEILLLKYLDHGYEVIKISGDIQEAWEVYDAEQKQIFYYDDFLGQTNINEKFNKNEDENLLRFINTIKSSDRTRFVMTTREYILNQAKASYERISRSNFDINKCVINLEKYTKYDRAKILYNHVYFSDLQREYKDTIIQNRGYLKIIEHHNFSPRLIDVMTEINNKNNTPATHYLKAFIETLDKPEYLWQHAFSKQISRSSRALLIVMYSMPDQVFIEDLEEAFVAYYGLVSRKFNFSSSPQDFLNSLKELEGNFIKIKRAINGNYVLLHNPSIRDFLNHYIESNPTELRLLCEAVIYYDQALKLCFQLPSFKEFTKKLAPLFADMPAVAMNLIDTKSIRLAPKFPEPGVISFGRAAYFLEQRMAEILPHIAKWQSEIINKQFKTIVERVIDKISDKKIERLEVNILVAALGSVGQLGDFGQTKFINAAKEYYFRRIEDLDDFNFIVSLGSLFPKCISDEEISEIQKLFESIYPQDIEAMIEDQDLGVEEFVRLQESLAEVAEFLKVNVDSTLESLEAHITELNDNNPDPGIDDDYRPTAQSSLNENESIASLFDSI